MSDNTKIEWSDATWNPVTGCDEVSAGCDHCYGKTFAERWRGTRGHYFENGFDVQLRPDKLTLPLKWRKPKRVFVNSMSDLFHKAVPDDYIARVFAVMAATPQHTYQPLTKRHARMRSFLKDECRCGSGHPPGAHLMSLMSWAATKHNPDWIPGLHHDAVNEATRGMTWGKVLPNVWLGVSVEHQHWADIRVPALLDTPARVRFLSCEPLLGPVGLSLWLDTPPACGCGVAPDGAPGAEGCSAGCMAPEPSGLDWVIVGGESGRGARPMHPAWARQLRDQCVIAGVPFLYKQWGNWAPVDPGAGAGHSTADYVTDDDRCQIVDSLGRLRGRPWPGWAIQDGTRDAATMRNYGKHKAGRLLDGRTWDEFPAVAS